MHTIKKKKHNDQEMFNKAYFNTIILVLRCLGSIMIRILYCTRLARHLQFDKKYNAVTRFLWFSWFLIDMLIAM